MMCLLACLLAALPGQEEDLRPGLVGEYYSPGVKLTDFPVPGPNLNPRFKRVDKQIDFDRTLEAFPGTRLREHYFICWTGLLRVPKDGKFRFFTVSDDGSRLFLAGKLVVDNGGIHVMKEASGEVDLKAGDQEIRVEYFQGTGHAGVRILWESGGVKDVIPPAALRHRKAVAPTEEERKGILLPVEVSRPEAKKVTEEKQVTPAKQEADPAPVDEKAVLRDGRPPDVSGRIVNLFPDGPLTLLTVRTKSGEERALYLHGDSKVEGKPAAGLAVHAWLKPGSADAVAEARLSK